MFICIINHTFFHNVPYLFTSHCNVESALNHHSDVLKDRVPLVPTKFRCMILWLHPLAVSFQRFLVSSKPYVRCMAYWIYFLAFYYTDQPNVGKNLPYTQIWVRWTCYSFGPANCHRYPGCRWLCRLLRRPGKTRFLLSGRTGTWVMESYVSGGAQSWVYTLLGDVPLFSREWTTYQCPVSRMTTIIFLEDLLSEISLPSSCLTMSCLYAATSPLFIPKSMRL